VYWSHLATYRVTNWKLLGVKPLRTMDDLAAVAREAVARGYTAFKTNIIWPGEPARRITQGTTGPHDQLAAREIIDQAVAQIRTMREAVGPSIDICLDVNVNFKPSEAVRLARELEHFGLFWLEIDNQDPHALAQLRVVRGNGSARRTRTAHPNRWARAPMRQRTPLDLPEPQSVRLGVERQNHGIRSRAHALIPHRYGSFRFSGIAKAA
jgi:Enolase C-terminal domain-like